MAMDLGGAKGGVKSDINVTPLVDVMLVLLIIMMLVAPMLEQGVQVKLPVATNATPKPQSAISARFRRARNSRRCLRLPLAELLPARLRLV